VLPGWTVEDHAHATAGGAAFGTLPRRLAPDDLALVLDHRPADAEDRGAGGGEVHVGAPVVNLIARAVVPGGHADGDSHPRRDLQALVDLLEGGFRPVGAVLGQAPAH